MTTRRGFTLVETIVALSLAAAVILPAVFLFLRGTSGMRARLDSQATTQSLASDLEGLLRRDLNSAAAGLVTTPNSTGIMVRSGGPDATAQDTLILVIPTGSPWQVSVAACGSGAATCLRILGHAADSMPEFSLVHIAAPTLGGVLAQLGAVDTTSAPCGLDCQEPPLSCVESLVSDLLRLRVVGSRVVSAAGVVGVVAPNIPCDSTVYGDGRTCQELYASEPVDTNRVLTCTAPTTPSVPYSDVTVTDRTATLGFLAAPLAIPYRSGPRGYPLVTVQPVQVIRYYLRATASGTSQLIREVNLDATGAWNAPEVISNRLTRWRVSTIHAGSNAYARGFGVTAGDLTWLGANANRWNLTGATVPDSAWVGFIRSAASVAGFQVDFTVLPRNVGAQGTPEARAPKAFRIQVALPRFLDGGSPFPGAH